MNKETYNKLIAHPENITGMHKSDLKELLEQFPYCQNLKVAYLNSLYQSEDLLFESELKKTAAGISNRAILRTLFVKPSDQSEYILSTSSLTPPLSVVEDETIEEPVELKVEKEEKKEESEEGEEIKPLIPELEQQILAEAISASIEIEAAEDIPFELEEKEGNTEIKSIESVEKKPSKLSFLGWLDKIEDQNALKEESEFRQHAAQIVDQFITTKPQLEVKQEFFSAVNMARKSLDDSDIIVSETLAKIYAQQGNIKKAIQSYEKLSLKFPEKKAFFASLIKDLKNE